MPTIRQLEYLVALAETHRFRQAAERCGVSQPTLSAQLKVLETRLGADLVERGQPGVILTPVGEQILEKGREVLRLVQEMREIAISYGAGLGGTVRLGLPPTIGPYLLPKMLPRLHGDYPDLRLFVREEVPQTLPRNLQAGRYDLLITPLPVAGADLESMPLFREPLFIAMARDHPLANQREVERADLFGEAILTLETGHQLHEQVASLCEEIGAKLRFDFEGTSLDTLRQMVGMGAGLSFLPGLFVQSVLTQDEAVIARPLKGPAVFRTIGMVWRRSSPLTDRYSSLADYVRDTIKREYPGFPRL